MLLFPEIAKDIIGKLIKEECEGRPMTLDQALQLWGQNSTWVGLISDSYISPRSDAVTVTEKGRKWYNKYRYQIEAPMNLPPA